MIRVHEAGPTGPRFRRLGPLLYRSAPTRALLLCALVGISGCDDGGDERLDRLNAAWASWTAAAPGDYRFDYRRSCFCPFVEEVRVFVGDGSVAKVTSLETLEPLPEERNADFPTVDELFLELDRLIRANPHFLQVEYDPEFGFPSFADVDIEERIADEEFSYTVRNFDRVPADGSSLQIEVRP